MKAEIFPRPKAVPPLVRVVLTQAIRRRATGGITTQTFAAQLTRLVEEELNPKGLNLVVRELPGGRIRFLIKEISSGAVCDMLDFASNGTLDPGTAED